MLACVICVSTDATLHVNQLIANAMAVAEAPEQHKLSELQMAASLLQHDQVEHGNSTHCPDWSMDRMNERLKNLVGAISSRVAAEGV